MPAHPPPGRRKVCLRYAVLDELLQAGAAITVSDIAIRLKGRRLFCDPATIYAALTAIEISFKNIALERTIVRAGKSRAEAFRAYFVKNEHRECKN